MTSSPATQGPLLSIVVLVYNTGCYLRECFDSLLGQEYRNIEIIAIDDASTDDSLAICREYEAAHPNFRCISKPNEGGAVAGNLGIGLACGEYVALVDSDDLVTPRGYRLLMEEAQRVGADIVVGRAARLSEADTSSAAFLHEPDVWSRRRVLHTVDEFIELHHDGFYWNKVFRTSFLREHRLGMVPGLLYADRPFVHAAYWHSRRTAIITDLVYLWRVREDGRAPSITQNHRQADNFRDRLRSARIEWERHAGVTESQAWRNAIAVNNLHRALFTRSAVAASPSFRAAFMQEMQALLSLYGDLDLRSLGARRCLYLELIRRGEVEAFCFLVGMSVDRDEIVEIGGECYWKQPFLDNPEIPIAREVMRLDFPNIGFFQIDDLTLEAAQLSLTLHLHEAVMARCEVAFELHCTGDGRSTAFQALGQVGRHRWQYALDPGSVGGIAGDPQGLVMRYTTRDGIRGRYRIGPPMLSGALQSRLPLAGASGRLELSAAAGSLAFSVI